MLDAALAALPNPMELELRAEAGAPTPPARPAAPPAERAPAPAVAPVARANASLMARASAGLTPFISSSAAKSAGVPSGMRALKVAAIWSWGLGNTLSSVSVRPTSRCTILV